MSAELDRADAASALPTPLSPALAALAALAATLGSDLRPLRWLGRSVAGAWMALGRADGANGGLVILELPASWQGDPGTVPPPVVHRTLTPAMPVAVGAGIAADDPATGGLSREVLLDAVRGAAAELYEVLGDLPAEGHGLVYFALARDGGALHALQLQQEVQAGGEVEFVLAVFPVAETAGPEAGSGSTAATPSSAAPPERGAPPNGNVAADPGLDTIVPPPPASIARPTRTIAAPALTARAASQPGGFTSIFGAPAVSNTVAPPAPPVAPPASPATVTPTTAGTGPKSCPQCGAEYPADVRFCPLDGSTLRAASSGDDLVGQVIADRYHVEKILGEGGMGRVYLAEHVRMGRRSAVKVMGRALLNDRDALSRFNREAANAARINHHHVAAIYDFGETHDGLVYLAMEFVEGEPLTNLVRREKALEPGRAAIIVNQVADGLDAAHALGIVHRDLKPDNIMVARGRSGGDWVKIVDFGIAKDARGGQAQQVTKTGLVIGTPEYMSPEQLTAENVDGRSDVYSLALVAFVLLTGQLPFEAGTTEAVLMSRLVGKPRTLAEVRPDVDWPASVQAVFDVALSKTAAERFATAGELGRALCATVNEWVGLPESPTGAAGMLTPARVTPVGATPLSNAAVPPTRVATAAPGPDAADATRTTTGGATPAARRRTPMLAVASVLVVALLGGGAYMASQSGGDDGGPVATADSGAAARPSGGPAVDPGTTTPTNGTGTPPATDVELLGEKQGTGAPPARPASDPAPPVRPASNDATSPDTPGSGAPAVDVRAELARIARLADPNAFNEQNARLALDAVRALRPQLRTPADSVELDFHAAEAHMILGQQADACRILRPLAARAKGGAFERAIDNYLANGICD